jgi:uncharacterized lipoprotein YajG
MKKRFLKPLLFSALILTAMQLPACKSKTKTTETTTDTTVTVTDTVAQTAPVVIAEDDTLSKNTVDAVKDFPGVKAEVMNGEINLTGEITREKLQQLMMSLNALHPKKINNNLTIIK